MTADSTTGDYGRFDELAEEFAARYRRGERPSLQEYIDRCREMADEIRELFPALVEVEQVEGDLDATGSASPAPAVAAPSLDQVGDYRIIREVGRGGMGVVYEAEQVSLGRRVALKVLPRHVARDGKALERFRREARAAARLHHTNIVPVFEVGHDDDVVFYAMQFIQGQGLDQVVDELARLRDRSNRHGSAGGGVAARLSGSAPGPPAVVVAGASDPARERVVTAFRERQLGRMAGSLLTGRFVSGSSGRLDDGPVACDLDATEGAGSGETARTSWTPGRFATRTPDPVTSSSVRLPGGTQISAIEPSGRRRPFFRSVAQIGRQAAQGLAYAHQRGIVHRDIKPSNLLLDTAGVVWITDFGLAKAEEDGLTQTGDILGTLRYMAPERFRGEGDSRADTYALGLTLYELITLRPAFQSPDRLRLIQQIKNEDPPRPRSLDPNIPRDLETIVLKAIDKHPASRYQSADAFAEDLRRYLDDEPILARRTTAAERYLRWARRHPGIAALGAVLTAVLVIATAASIAVAAHMAQLAERESIAARNERIARVAAQKDRETARTNLREADAQRERAERGFAQARAAVDEYLTKVSESQLLTVPGLQPLRKDLLTSALRFYEDFLRRESNDPALRSALAAVRLKAAAIHVELGEKDEAAEAYRQALAQCEAIARERPADVEARNAMAEGLLGLADTGASEQARPYLLAHSVSIREALVRERPGDRRFRMDLERSYSAVGELDLKQFRVKEALDAFLKARDIGASLIRDDPDNPAYQYDFAEDLGSIANTLCQLKRHQDETLVRPLAIEHARVAYEAAPQVVKYGQLYASLCVRDASNLESQGRAAEGLEFQLRGARILLTLCRENPSVETLHATLVGTIARMLNKFGRLDDAVTPELTSRALREVRGLLDEMPHENADQLAGYANVLAHLAQLRDRLAPTADDAARRAADAERAVESLRRAVALGYGDVDALKSFPTTRNLKANAEIQALAAEVERAANADSPPAAGVAAAAPPPPAAARPSIASLEAELAASQQAVGLVQIGLKDWDAAARSLRQAHELAGRAAASSRQDDLAPLIAMAHAEWVSGRWEQAARTWAESILPKTRGASGEARTISRREAQALADFATAVAEEAAWDVALGPARVLADNLGALDLPQTQLQTFASLLYGRGNEGRYRAICRHMLARFGDSNESAVLEGLVHTLTMGPDPGVDRARILGLAARLKNRESLVSWNNYAVAAAHFRAGQDAEAIARCEESVAIDAPWANLNGLPWYLLAMAHHRLGHADAARAALERGDASVSMAAWRYLADGPDAPPRLPSWRLLVLLTAAREEAHAAFGTPAEADPWVLLLDARNLARLGRGAEAEGRRRRAVAIRPGDATLKQAAERLAAAPAAPAGDDPAVPSGSGRNEARSLLERGFILEELGRRDEARDAFRRALAAGPETLDDWTALLRRAEGIDERGRITGELLAHLKASRARSPAPILPPYPPELEGRVRSASGGAACSLRLLNLTPDTLTLHWIGLDGRRQRYGTIDPWGSAVQPTGVAQYWLLTGSSGKPLALFLAKTGEGLAVVTEATARGEVDPPDDPDLLTAMGQIYAARGDDRRAEAALRRGVEARPNDPMIWMARSRFRASHGRTAEASADFERAMALAASDPGRFLAIGDDLARRGDWEAAAVVFDRAIAAAPSNHWYWYMRGPLYLMTGDVAGYRRFRRAMLDRFGENEGAGTSERTAKVGLLLPATPDERGRFARMAASALAAERQSQWLAYFLATAALAEYRLGHDPQALALVARIPFASSQANAPPKAVGRLVSAMAQRRLGRADQARRSLQLAGELIGPSTPPVPSAFLTEWWDWAMCVILRREAEALILDPGFPADPFATPR